MLVFVLVLVLLIGRNCRCNGSEEVHSRSNLLVVNRLAWTVTKTLCFKIYVED